MLNQQSNDEQEGENHAPYPQRDRRPMNLQLLFSRKLEKEHAGAGQNRSGQEESGAQDKRNAVLGALKANQGDGGKDKGQHAGYDLKVAL